MSLSVTVPLFAQLSEEEQVEYWASLALRHTAGIGVRTIHNLCHIYGSAFAAVQALKKKTGWEAHIDSAKVSSFQSEKWREPAKKEWDATRAGRCGILLWSNPHYPPLLRAIVDAPCILYTAGDVSLLANPAIALVGSRLCSVEGRKASQKLGKELARQGVTVISGMAQGVDFYAHQAAVTEVASTIAVLGTGLDIAYPPKNAALQEQIAEKGLLLSEFCLGTVPYKTNFPVRNRIISGLSLGTVVVEAAARSGSLITARLALEQDRQVYAVPGSATAQYSYGCRDLIRKGAQAVFSAEDILRDIAQYGSELYADLEKQAAALEKQAGILHGKKITNAISAKTSAASKKEQKTGNHDIEKAIKRNEPEKTDKKKAQSSKSTMQQLFSAEEQRILDCVQEQTGIHIDAICQQTQLPVAEVSSLLVLLELKKCLRFLPGMHYECV